MLDIYTVADIQQRGGREVREREEEAQQQRQEARRDQARTEETHLQEEGVVEKRARTDKSDTETEAGGETGASHYKKGRMTNIYLMNFDEEVIVDFMKDQTNTIGQMNISRTKPGRSASRRGSLTVANCLSRCAKT